MSDRHEARSQFSGFMVAWDWFGQFLRDISAGLEALTRVQYDRPWQRVDRG